MVEVTHTCPECGLVFAGGIVVNDVDSLTLVGNKSSCPRCGTMSPTSLADGTYRVRGSRFQLLRTVVQDVLSAGASREEIERLRTLVEEAKAQDQQAQEVASRIEAETPNLSALAETFRQRPDLLIFLLTLIQTVVTALAWQFPKTLDQPPSLTPEQVETVISQTIEEIEQQEQEAGPRPNDPCPCGSHDKYKRCHGKQRR